MYIYNADLLTMSDMGNIGCGFVRVENGRIAEIGQGEPPCIGSGDINAAGGVLCPGLIDIHTHMGFIGDGASQEDADVNEGSEPVTPHLRAQDGLDYYDGYWKDAVKAGVTSVVTGVGSLNPIGGSMIAVKTAARCLDDAIIRTVGMKFALGENPKSYYSRQDERPQTRMATAALIREALFRAARYRDLCGAAEEISDYPEYDIKCEALVPLLEGELAAHFHCHRADDILTALRICDEFNIRPLLIHCTEGYLISDILAEKKACAVIGPVLCDRGKPELKNASYENAAILDRAGVKIALCTDHPENPIGLLLTGAACCVKNGLSRETALKAVTCNAAELGGFGDRTGRIAAGLDADLVLFDRDPLDFYANVMFTMAEGRVVYSSESGE